MTKPIILSFKESKTLLEERQTVLDFDQILYSAASDLGLLCLLKSIQKFSVLSCSQEKHDEQVNGWTNKSPKSNTPLQHL